MSTIQTLFSIDTETLSAEVEDGKIKPGSIQEPTVIEPYSKSGVYMVLQTSGIIVTNATSEKQLISASSNELEFNALSIGNNESFTVYIYRVSIEKVYNKPTQYILDQVQTYLPPTAEPTAKTVATTRSIYSTTEASMEFRSKLDFAVINNATGKALGYFSWVPPILLNS